MKKFKKILFIFIVSIFVILTTFYFYTKDMYPYSNPNTGGEYVYKDLRTRKERIFCDSLLSLNYNDIKIQKRIYFHKGERQMCYQYYVYYKRTPAFNENQPDSINLLNLKIMTSLLRNYVSDRMIYENTEFYIAYDDLPDPFRTMKKKLIQKLCGFKVIKTGKFKYKRINIGKKVEPSVSLIPYSWVSPNGTY